MSWRARARSSRRRCQGAGREAFAGGWRTMTTVATPVRQVQTLIEEVGGAEREAEQVVGVEIEEGEEMGFQGRRRVEIADDGFRSFGFT